ncbi:DUF6235 family protein [Actinomycetospora atypica]|uniref:DUF6235 family protein n=1 Tax=Actinomycetospora atypica TaxID=1290095 RepID=A0ABV9YN16_9PSEU
MDPPLRLVGAEDAIDDFSDDATQADRNVVYEALFAIVDGSVEEQYDVRSEDGRYQIELGRDLEVRGGIDEESFSVESIDRQPPGAEEPETP